MSKDHVERLRELEEEVMILKAKRACDRAKIERMECMIGCLLMEFSGPYADRMWAMWQDAKDDGSILSHFAFQTGRRR